MNEKYFRFNLDLLYNGKPFPIDFVAGCSTKITSYVFGGSSWDHTGMTAFIYAIATPDGHAIGVRTISDGGGPNPCFGDTTANGKVPRDWLPLIVWFERADELGHGIAYATQDAYRNPNARFDFRGVTINRATKEEFESFTRNGPKNLFPPYQTDWLRWPPPPLAPEGRIPKRFIERPQAAWRYAYGRSCTGVMRIRLTEAQRAEVRTFWPADRPRFWIPADTGQWDKLRLSIPSRDQTRLVQRAYRDRDAMAEDDADRKSYEIFPSSMNYSLNRVNKEIAIDGQHYLDIQIEDARQLRGFMYCSSITPEELVKAIADQEKVFDHPLNLHCRVDGKMFEPPIPDCTLPKFIIYENDEFALSTVPAVNF